MNTPRLDEKINDLEMLNSSDELNDKGKELLNEFKAIKKALNIQSVSKPLCDVCGSDDVAEYPHVGFTCYTCNPM
jgi:hypothetical protein